MGCPDKVTPASADCHAPLHLIAVVMVMFTIYKFHRKIFKPHMFLLSTGICTQLLPMDLWQMYSATQQESIFLLHSSIKDWVQQIFIKKPLFTWS